MKLNPLEIYLDKPYLSKTLESSALKSVLDSSFQTAYRLYLLVNDVEELQYFVSGDKISDKYFLTAYIKTEYAFIGNARKQIWQITHLQPLLRKKPIYTLRCALTRISDNKELYRCNSVNKSESFMYDLVQKCISDLNNIIKEHENVKEG